MPSATFAIISDLHCRLANSPADSFLTVGAPRLPSERHPVESLLQLIDREQPAADALLVPGDITSRACREGLSQGWDYALEIGRRLGAPVIPVIGNHDVDSHGLYLPDPPLELVRTLRDQFPFSSGRDVNAFLADGYCLLSVGPAQLVAINTVLDSSNPVVAKRGAFPAERIAAMERALRDRLTSPLRGAIMHHHPVLHSGLSLRDTDVIETGDALMGALGRLGCRFVIHGHKHFTRLLYRDGIAILACGSFSAALHELATAFGNTFHIMEVEGDRTEAVRGTLKTWTFQMGRGWTRSNQQYRGFPFISGFGRSATISSVVSSLRALADADPAQSRFRQSEVIAAAPDARFLTPDERDEVNRALSATSLKLDDYDGGQLELWKSYSP